MNKKFSLKKKFLSQPKTLCEKSNMHFFKTKLGFEIRKNRKSLREGYTINKRKMNKRFNFFFFG